MCTVHNDLTSAKSFKGANIIFAGMCLNACVMGALMRPLELSIKEPKQRNQGCRMRRNLILADYLVVVHSVYHLYEGQC